MFNASFICGVAGRGIETRFCSKANAHQTPRPQGITAQHRRSRHSGKKGEQQSYGSLPDDKYHLGGTDPGLLNCLQTGIYRFHERRFFERHVGRNRSHAPLDNVSHDPHVLREAPAIRVKAGRHASLLVLSALREQLPAAVKAGSTWNVMKTDYAIAGTPSGHTDIGFHDRPRYFVAENLR
jgi:hypothetical protein